MKKDNEKKNVHVNINRLLSQNKETEYIYIEQRGKRKGKIINTRTWKIILRDSCHKTEYKLNIIALKKQKQKIRTTKLPNQSILKLKLLSYNKGIKHND